MELILRSRSAKCDDSDTSIERIISCVDRCTLMYSRGMHYTNGTININFFINRLAHSQENVMSHARMTLSAGNSTSVQAFDQCKAKFSLDQPIQGSYLHEHQSHFVLDPSEAAILWFLLRSCADASTSKMIANSAD